MAFSKTIQLGEHLYILPKVPPKSEIFFSDLPKADQYWRRLPVPEFALKYKSGMTVEFADKTKLSQNGGYLESLSYDDTLALLEYREQDLKRRWEGIWFMNKGEPTYLTGGQYFQLQWGAMPGYENPYTGFNYGEFRKFQRDVHYMLDLGKKDNNCTGVNFGKAKKTGITNLLAIDYVDESTRHKEKYFGMMSKSEKDCKDTGFKYYMYCFNKLPDIFKPSVSNSTQSELKIGIPPVKNTGTKHAAKKMAFREEGLDNQVFVSPTKADGFDGPKVFRGWVDEFSKLIDPYPDIVNKKTRETVKLGYKIVGKLWYSSYVAEDDGKNFTEAKAVWYNSGLDTRGDTERTISGLYKYFIPGDLSYEHNPDGFTYDVYGDTDRDKARHIIMENRKQKEHDPAQLQAEIRQYPLNEHEMWQEGGGGRAVFDNIRLGNQLAAVEEFLKSGQNNYEMGTFEWVDPDKSIGNGYGKGVFGEVKWVPLSAAEISSGKTAPFFWNGSSLVKKDSFNIPVKKSMVDRYGYYKPSDMPDYCGGCDPTDYQFKSLLSTAGSNDAICIEQLPDMELNGVMGQDVSGRPILFYYYRHEAPDDFYEDLVKCMLFFGAPFYVEGNKKWVIKKLIEDHLYNFLAMRGEGNIIEMYDKHKNTQKTLDTVKSGGVNTVEDIIVTIKRRIKKPDSPEEHDKITNLWYAPLLKQLMRFDATNTKAFDIVMAYGFCQMLRETLIGMRNKPSKHNADEIQRLFKNFMNKDVPYVKQPLTNDI